MGMEYWTMRRHELTSNRLSRSRRSCKTALKWPPSPVAHRRRPPSRRNRLHRTFIMEQHTGQPFPFAVHAMCTASGGHTPLFAILCLMYVHTMSPSRIRVPLARCDDGGTQRTPFQHNVHTYHPKACQPAGEAYPAGILRSYRASDYGGTKRLQRTFHANMPPTE